MATEYGIRDDNGDEWGWARGNAEAYVLCTTWGNPMLIAREVSEPRIVSIRA